MSEAWHQALDGAYLVAVAVNAVLLAAVAVMVWWALAALHEGH